MPGLPLWIQIVLTSAALVAAGLTLWTKVLRPGALLVALATEVLPLLKEIVETFRGQPDTFKVLHEIAAEFRSDSGSTLRDAVNRLDHAAIENTRVAAQLQISVEAARRLATDDRQQLSELLIKLGMLDLKVREIPAATIVAAHADAQDPATPDTGLLIVEGKPPHS